MTRYSATRERGLAARGFLERRIADNGGAMVISWQLRGKWRRWIAEVSLADGTGVLNDELAEAGPVRRWFEKPDRPPTRRLAVELDPQAHRNLAARARTLDLTPGELARDVITDYRE